MENLRWPCCHWPIDAKRLSDERAKLLGQVDALTQQRDELAEALRGVIGVWDQNAYEGADGDFAMIDSADLEFVRRLLAKLEADDD